MKFNIRDYPIVFLMYEESNKEKNYNRLLEIYPEAKLVAGVKGSDMAHKEVARVVGDSKRVTIIDGDNYVLENLLDFKAEIRDDINLNDKVISFSAFNPLNGNCYGNGGIKNWPTDLLKSMRTHENSNDKNSVDFDFNTYLQFNKHLSETQITDSPLQAWRSGFREGIKLCMEGGKIVDNIDQINWRNYDRLWRWTHIGTDVENGLWAIYGSRMAMYLALVTKYELSKLRDFDELNKMFEGVYNNYKSQVLIECNRLGSLIKQKTNDNRFTDVYSIEQSIEFKKIPTILRSPETFIKYKYYPPYDVVFISYDEPNREENYNKLKAICPNAKRIDGIKGIQKAHIEAAKLCKTDYFWVVDGDASVVDNFVFEYEVDFYEPCKVRVWRSVNPVNGLVYGYGGVKLLPRTQTIIMDTSKPDMTTSISKYYEPIFKIASTTNFNSDPFHTWRGAFRESTKLASQIIDRQNEGETLERLNTWCTVGLDKPYGKYAIEGAKQGKLFGAENKNNIEELQRINDFNWLKSKFEQTYK